MFPFRKESNEAKHEMLKLKNYLSLVKEKIQHIYTSNYNSNFGEILELYTTLENCYESFNAQPQANTNFWIPDELLTPHFSSTDPILSLHESLEYLGKLYDFLTEFKDNIKNLPVVTPIDRKQKIQITQNKQPQKTKSLRLPIGILNTEKCTESAIQDKSVPPTAIINNPEPLAMAQRRISIDKKLLGNEYVPFNVAIPDERENEKSTLLNQPSSILPSINISEYVVDQIETLDNQIHTVMEPNTRNKTGNSTEAISKSYAYESVSDVPELGVPRHNISQENACSLINVQTFQDESEIQNHPNVVQQQTVAEVPAAELTDIDQNALEILQELSQQKSQRIKKITCLSDSTSSSNTDQTKITTDVPIRLKKAKIKKIRDQLVLLPHDISDYKLQSHYFHFLFNVPTQIVIDVITKLRSTLRCTSSSIITQSSLQRNLNDNEEVPLPAVNLTHSQSEVQRLRLTTSNLEKPTDIPHIEIQPDIGRQSLLQLSTLDNIEQSSIVAPINLTQISPMPVIGPIVEPQIDKSKLPDASYTNFENLLLEQHPNRKATPKKTEITLATDKKSLGQMDEGDIIKNMERDQYVTFCVLREIQRKYPDSNQITIQSIQAHFGNDRIGYCKLIRTAIDLHCHKLIRIVKEGNEISGINISI